MSNWKLEFPLRFEMWGIEWGHSRHDINIKRNYLLSQHHREVPWVAHTKMFYSWLFCYWREWSIQVLLAAAAVALKGLLWVQSLCIQFCYFSPFIMDRSTSHLCDTQIYIPNDKLPDSSLLNRRHLSTIWQDCIFARCFLLHPGWILERPVCLLLHPGFWPVAAFC